MQPGVASITARRVAEYRLGFDRVVTAYGDPAADELLTRDVADGATARPDGPMATYLAARTAFFDRIVVDAIDRGITQVVVAAAGYDGRAWRYAAPGVRWFEVDHPDTQRDKLARLHRLGISSDDVSFVPADFSTDEVGDGLAAAGHRADEPTLVLCEGVAVYLDEAVLISLLRQLRSVAGAGSRLAISLSVSSSGRADDDAVRSVRREQFQRAVAALGEPARCTLTSDDADSLFASTGWALLESSRDDSRRQRARHVGLVLARPV